MIAGLGQEDTFLVISNGPHLSIVHCDTSWWCQIILTCKQGIQCNKIWIKLSYIEALRACETSLESLHRTKPMAPGAIFDRFDG